ncbi:zinc finger protein RFP-like [Tiliqua scincoides]|uniref:zinc finger protein RFP-like n=1 Tax=Tiliqua scincoides TaxID=71010 RepID=UPI0034632B43
MAVAGSALQGLREEASCPICLDYFKEPVMLISCGHNFCQGCLAGYCQDWEAAGCCCPQCREPFLQQHLRPNGQLASLVDVARRLSLETRGGTGRECQKHLEPLKLFCKEDQALICLVCRESRDHRGHTVLPTEEAAQEYKDHVQSQLDNLRKQREKTVVSKWRGKQESQSLLKQTKTERQKLMTEFKNMRLLLEEKEYVLLASLDELDKRIMKRRDEQDARLSEECSSLDKLVQEMEEKCQQPAWEFLQDIKTLLQRYEAGMLPKSVASPSELKQQIKEFSDMNPVLQCIMKQFKDSLHTEHLLCKENVTLDLGTAHPGLSLSKDQRSVRLGTTQQDLPSTPERFDTCFCVLGQSGFSSGSHWWEVEVDERGVWAVGIARISVERKGQVGFHPEEGIWAVGQFLGGHYLALTSPKHLLLLNKKLRKIRVSLDYEMGQVTFLDADTEARIFTFTQALFNGERVLPWFWVGGLASQLRLSL